MAFVLQALKFIGSNNRFFPILLNLIHLKKTFFGWYGIFAVTDLIEGCLSTIQ